MKKTLIATIALLVAFSFSACDTVVKTKTELITQSKGWILTQATCSPDYRLNDGTLCDTDLLNGGFFLDCEKDDVFHFKSDHSFVMNYGKVKCPFNDEGKEETMGRWEFQENETWVQFFMGAYYDDENNEYFKLRGVIKELDANTLRLEVPITENYPIAKARMLRGETYPYNGTFYLIFSVNK